VALLDHRRRQPVVATGGQHALLQHGAGGDHPGDVPLEQAALGGHRFELVAEGDAQAMAHQLGAIALGGVVRDAGHRHAADPLARLLAGEGQLQQAREQQGVLEKELKEIPQAVEQHPIGVGRLERYVVAQHRRQGRRIQQAVVVPTGQFGSIGGAGFRWARLGPDLALTGPGGSLGDQGCVVEPGFIWISFSWIGPGRSLG